MPVNYPTGIVDEHRTTRTSVGVFDVCHMGEIHLRGGRAGEVVQRLVTNNVAKLTDGGALYAVACWPSGGIVDDLIVYCGPSLGRSPA
jgi:aminomethyltransferase